MDLFDFLDVNEKRQLQLIKKLLEKGEAGIALKDAKKFLGVTTPVLNEVLQQTQVEIKELNENAVINYQKIENQMFISIDTPDDFNFFKLYSNYLTNSINYQILKAILDNGKLVVPVIASTLFLSEASIFRRIKSINQALKEFRIQIKQGTVVGPESQIRYFYYNMIINSYAIDDLITSLPNTMTNVALDILERKYHLCFSETGRLRLNVWGNIFLKRMNIKNKNFSNLTIPSSLEGNHLYRGIKNAIYTTISQYAITVDEYEIYMIYQLISSIEVFDISATPDDVLQTYFKDGGEDIEGINEHFINLLSTVYPDVFKNLDKRFLNYLYYVVNQLHHKIQYFEGTFYFFRGESISRLIDNETYFSIKELATTHIRYVFKKFKIPESNQMFEIAVRRCFDLIIKVHRLSSSKITIGLHLHYDYEVILGIVWRMNNFFSPFYHLEIEMAKKEKPYDLFITDSIIKSSSFTFNRLYLLNELETNYDIEKLKNTLTNIYKEKYEK